MLEVILAGFILTVTIFGSYSLIQQTITAAGLNQDRLIAFYLAQEGVENVRNKRDTNWLQWEDWDDIPGYQSESPVGFLDNSQSKFNRITRINNTGDYLEVRVTVQWTARGKDHSVEVINHLYDWR